MNKTNSKNNIATPTRSKNSSRDNSATPTRNKNNNSYSNNSRDNTCLFFNIGLITIINYMHEYLSNI